MEGAIEHEEDKMGGREQKKNPLVWTNYKTTLKLPIFQMGNILFLDVVINY